MPKASYPQRCLSLEFLVGRFVLCPLPVIFENYNALRTHLQTVLQLRDAVPLHRIQSLSSAVKLKNHCVIKVLYFVAALPKCYRIRKYLCVTVRLLTLLSCVCDRPWVHWRPPWPWPAAPGTDLPPTLRPVPELCLTSARGLASRLPGSGAVGPMPLALLSARLPAWDSPRRAKSCCHGRSYLSAPGAGCSVARLHGVCLTPNKGCF